MTDRELLEHAAKAAGFSIGFSESTHDEGRPYVRNDDRKTSRWWNPLTDDADALRLAVKLKIEPKWPYTGEAWAVKGEALIIEDGGSDLYAATRRAIVRTAAEIGRA